MKLPDAVRLGQSTERPELGRVVRGSAGTALFLVGRSAWPVVAVAFLALFSLGLAPLYTLARTAGPSTGFPFWQFSPADARGLQALGISLDFYAAYRIAVQLLGLVGFAGAVVIFRRKPEDPVALLASFTLLALCTLQAISVLATLMDVEPRLGRPANLLLIASFCLLCLFFYVFPNGRWVPRWARVPVLLGTLAVLLLTFGPGSSRAKADGAMGLLVLALILGGVPAQIYRYIHVSDRLQRQQTKWIMVGTLVALWALLIEHSQSSLWFWAPPWVYYVFHPLMFNSAFVALSISLTFSTLHHRLWDLDRLINGALVYGTLGLFIVGVYVLYLLGWGAGIGPGTFVLAVIATALIALLVAPLRERLRRAADQLMYGEHDEPYAVLSRLGQQLEALIDPVAVLPTIAETVADALKLTYVELALKQSQQYRVAAAYGVKPKPEVGPESESELLAFPLVYVHETVGELRVAPRSSGEALTATDLALLRNLARQAGTAAHAVQLTGELELSLQRMVNAREEARRRLGSDLHDGLGHRLAGLLRKAETASNLLDGDSSDPTSTRLLLAELQGQARAAIDEVRSLAHTLHPPELELLGLAGALRERARDYHEGAGGERLQVTVDAPDRLPALPAAVEAAAYYIAQEALTNVVRHSGARHCHVCLRLIAPGDRAVSDSVHQALELEVCDDGQGLDASRELTGEALPGLGLTSMRERAMELGGICEVESPAAGGMCVLARLPFPYPPT